MEFTNMTSIADLNATDPSSVPFRDQVPLIIFGTVDGILMLAILLGNILVILAVRLSRKLSGVTSCKFILNLAVCDFFVGLTLPYHMTFYVMGHDSQSEKIPCILRFVLISFACTSSILNLILIAIDRYIAIVYPLHYTRYMTRQTANSLIICGWLLAFGVATIPLYWNAWTPDSECAMEKVMPKYYVNLVLTPLFMAIWSTMFTLYFRIWKEAYGHAKRLRNFQNGTASDWKSMQMVLLILGCFTICWLPYLIVMIYKKATENIVSSHVYEATFTLAMANSCMNPIIYAWKNSNFRKAFGCLLKCTRPNMEHRSFITNHNNMPNNVDGERIASVKKCQQFMENVLKNKTDIRIEENVKKKPCLKPAAAVNTDV